MKRWRWIFLLLVTILVAAWFALPGIVERRFNRTLHPPPYQPSAQAQVLHRTLTVADLHADSLLWGRNLLRRSNRGHVDLPRLAEGIVSIQAFTIVTTAPRKLNIYKNSDSTDQITAIAVFEGWPKSTWSSPRQRAVYQAGRLHQFAERSHGVLTVIHSRAELQRFLTHRQPGQVAGFLGTEGAQPLEGDLGYLDSLYSAGIRMMSPTHFTDTAIAGAAAGLTKSGLSDFGSKWVRAMESHHMLIDLAHASPATLRDVTAMATRPLIVSHTGVKGTCNNPRNLSDDELRAVAHTNGVIGIGLWDTATCGSDARATARAIHYAMNIVGSDHVALGSDFDGGITAPFDSSGWALLTDALLQEGIAEQDIHKIMGENVVRVLLETLPN
jgi:microsomal dipeptidase-like Zn-dependent dipeptidase